MIEKVPVMIAWLPTTAARIAIAKTGHLICSEDVDFVNVNTQKREKNYDEHLFIPIIEDLQN